MQKGLQKESGIRVMLCLVTLVFAGCAPVQRYHPAPISAAETAAALEARSLRDPGLRRFIEKNRGCPASPWPPQAWDLKALTLAAMYFSPALQQAREEVSAAQAAVVTAGARPNPTLSLQPGVPSPYLFSLDFLALIQTSGKRKLRVERARDLTREARFTLAEAAWVVRRKVRAALVNYFLATRRISLLRLEQRLERRRVLLLQQRFAAGEIARPRVEHARLVLLNLRVAQESAEGRVPEARAALAAAIGVPVGELKGVRLAWSGFEHPPKPAAFSPELIQRDAVLDRLDVRKALVAYEAAEDALQLQIAKQHPNFHLGPGNQFEESHNYFTLGYSVTIPIFNRNQGPIAEAKARRREAAAAFLGAQSRAIAESEEALARYRASTRVLRGTARALGQLERVVIPRERRTVAAGEADRLALNTVLLQRPVLALARLEALGRAQRALGALEDAVERPLESGGPAPPARKSSTRVEDLKR